MIIDERYVQALSYGSQILGFGGGGDAEDGRKMYEAAFEIARQNGHDIELITAQELEERHPNGGTVVTISGVGSPASDTAYTPPEYYTRLMELLEREGCDEVIGFIACEIGGSSSFEPFLPAAMMGVPIVDAPCDGRAHPLGLMGALGLEKKGLPVIQVGVGGKKGQLVRGEEEPLAGQYVEISVKASVETAAALIRNAAAQAGGAVSVARNPVDLIDLQGRGAKGAYAQASRIGGLWKELVDQRVEMDRAAVLLADLLGGEVLCEGRLSSYSCDTENALDHGSIRIVDERTAEEVTIDFFNEYMTLETAQGERKYTFPDGIVVFAEDLQICSSAMLEGRIGSRFAVVATKHHNLIIPPGLRHRQGYKTIEGVIKKDMIKYLDDGGFFLD